MANLFVLFISEPPNTDDLNLEIKFLPDICVVVLV